AAADEVVLRVRPRGTDRIEAIRAAWVVNCTGPGVEVRSRPSPIIGSLIRGGHLRADALGLGVLTGPAGEAISATGRTRDDLIVIGTLRKPALWESTAVPELRGQAADAAAAVLRRLRLEDAESKATHFVAPRS